MTSQRSGGAEAPGPNERLGNDEGAAVVEFALLFVFVVLPLVLFGMQLVLNTFIKQQATAGARDGARAAVVAYGLVDGSDKGRVQNAVRARLAFPEQNITVRCIRTSTALESPTTISCDSARPGSRPVSINTQDDFTVDSVEVVVDMTPMRVVGPFGIFLGPLLPSQISSSASMAVVTKS